MPHIQYFPESTSALLPIERPPIVDLIETRALQRGFEEKSEFHITAMPQAYGEQLGQQALALCLKLFEETDIDDVAYGDVVLSITKPKMVEGVSYPRESLIIPAHSAKLDNIFGEIGRITGVSLAPYVHTTLFTRGDSQYARRGIGIESADDLKVVDPDQFYP